MAKKKAEKAKPTREERHGQVLRGETPRVGDAVFLGANDGPRAAVVAVVRNHLGDIEVEGEPPQPYYREHQDALRVGFWCFPGECGTPES